MPFPVDEKYIVATEEKFGIKFPGSFRTKMQVENGGEVDAGSEIWRLYPFLDKSDNKRLKRTCNDIVRETASAKEWAGFPQNAIAIGANDSGDQLVFLTKRSDSVLDNKVYWWNHETGKVYKIATDFRKLQSRKNKLWDIGGYIKHKICMLFK